MKTYPFTVPQALEGRRMDAVATRMLPTLKPYIIRQAFQNRDVRGEGKRYRAEDRAVAGTRVVLYAPEPEAELTVCYEDTRLLIVRKPAGVPSQEDDQGGETIAQIAWRYLQKTDPTAACPLACHRLDNQTDGLLLLAKNEPIRAAMEDAFRNREIHKRYQCLVKGTPEPARAVRAAYLVKDAERAHVTIYDAPRPGALSIRTGYRVLESGEICRLQIELFTGRTHQIRAHLAHLGHPILGDDAYGDRAFNKRHRARRLALCACELTFTLSDPAYADLNQLQITLTPQF